MRTIQVLAIAAALLTNGAFAEQEKVVFQGGDMQVTYEDVERYIVENTPSNPREKTAVLNRPGIYREMAELIYTVRTLAAEAESMPDFDREQAEWTARMMYQRRIVKEYRKKYVTHMLKDVNWDKTAEEAYRVQKDQYVTEEKVSASHILIKVDGRNDEEAQTLASELRQRAVDGESFENLAREYSEDPSAERNAGSLGSFKRGQMVKPFEDVVFAMQEPGSISEVVKTPFGYHVIKFHSHTPAGQLPFESVKDEIIKELQVQMADQTWQDKVIAIRSAGDIESDETLLLELKEKYSKNVIPPKR